MRTLILQKALLLLAAIEFLSVMPGHTATDGGAADPATIVEATLLADTTALQPNTTITVGVLFKVQPGWHIYWQNPGSSGFATTVKWAMPTGISPTDEVQYPLPVSFESPGPIISFGYEGEVLLLSEARTGPTLPTSGEVEINAKTRWLMCSDRCIPGKKDLSLKLPVGKGQPANREIFEKYRAMLPKKVSSAPAGVAVTKTASGAKTTYQMQITPAAGQKVVGQDQLPQFRKAYFFPATQQGFLSADPQVPEATATSTGAGANIKVHSGPVTIAQTFEPEGATVTSAPRMKGVLVYQTVAENGTPGTVQSYEVDIAK